MVKNKNIIVEGKYNKPILTDVFYPETQDPKPIIVFCHGYKGFKDWGAWDLVAERFAEAGFFFVKFNFSHNGGTPEQPIDFPDLEAFGNNNYIKELDDLKTILDWMGTSDFEYKNEVNYENILLIGHSRGGGIVTIKAAEDPRITRVITWAGVSDYKNRFITGEALENWEKIGVFYIQNGRTKQKMPHYFQFYTSFIENEERLTISRAVAKLKIPYLIIHGTNDNAVDSSEGQNLHHWSTDSELFLIDDANHVFGTKHPWGSYNLSEDLKIIVEKSIAFAIL
ncbi:alpha/beta hydrolase family protein [Aquimarina pacifica]|uniref:alpha/beta hydrolase family protein n=1 Tax=Aquimarina pacifica TaxID=1296415 RepID=UPI00046F5312|nr:alpha/beta fold hydrolase [Aquimarina pacifica]